MHVSIVENTGTHLIKYVEFLDVTGWPVTSFFQTLELPNKSLGTSNSLAEAKQKIKKAA